MDYKYIEQLLERYWQAETSLEEERILKAFFAQETLPEEMECLRPLFSDDTAGQQATLGDDFDSHIIQLISDDEQAAGTQAVKAVKVSLSQRLMPLFKAAAVVAIILTVGSALQAPWDASWNDTAADIAQQQADSVSMARPVQAENVGETSIDSTKVLMPVSAKD